MVIIDADKQNIRPRKLLVDPAYIDYLEDNLIMGFDGISRSSQKAAKKTVISIKDSEKNDLIQELSSLTETGINLFCQEMNIIRHGMVTKRLEILNLS